MNIIEDLRRRHIRVPEAVKLLQYDQDAVQYALQEVQDVLKDMNGHPNFESFGFHVPTGELRALLQPEEKNVESAEELIERILISIKSFKDDQEAVFNALVGQILFGVTADYPFAAVCPKKSADA